MCLYPTGELDRAAQMDFCYPVQVKFKIAQQYDALLVAYWPELLIRTNEDRNDVVARAEIAWDSLVVPRWSRKVRGTSIAAII